MLEQSHQELDVFGHRFKSVALVDQNVVTRALLKVKLASAGHQVSVFESAADFLASAKCWDLVVVSSRSLCFFGAI